MVILFLASVLNFALRALQQLNVQHDKKLWVVPTATAIAVFEVTVITQVSRDGTLWSAIPLGLGGGLGCLMAMTLHSRFR